MAFYYFMKEKAAFVSGLGIRSFQKNATFSRSFAFFSKEQSVLALFCVLYKKNAAFFAFFAFFYVLYKIMMHSLRSLRSL